MNNRILALAACFIVATASAAEPEKIAMTKDQAAAFAKLALKGIGKEYPNKLDHVMTAAEDVKSPKALHPAFYGCFDWHSSVHGHWMLIRLLKTVPGLAVEAEIRAALRLNLTEANLKVEAEYYARPESKSFERPYGWAWLLKLAEELHGWDDADGKTWAKNLQPLVDVIVKRYLDYFPKQTYATRSGVHSNTAFGLAFAHDYAVKAKNDPLKALIVERAKFYFANDTDAPAKWEPGGADFFSPSLMEADLMRRVLPADEFKVWFAKFLPGVATAEPKSLFTPAIVTDRSDPHLVHLDGLNLSRAWCLKSIAAVYPLNDTTRLALEASATVHADAALKHVASGDYAGEHWLASFAVFMLTCTPNR